MSTISAQVDSNVTEQINTATSQSDKDQAESELQDVEAKIAEESTSSSTKGYSHALTAKLKHDLTGTAEDEIRELSAEKFSKEEIRAHLSFVGYCDEIINDAFKNVFGAPPEVAKKKIEMSTVFFRGGGQKKVYLGGGKYNDGEFPYSGYGKAATGWKSNKVLLIESFVEKNSFLGKGVTDMYQTQEGWSFDGPSGTTLQPYLTYQNASTNLTGSNTYHANTYGAVLNFTQKIVPLSAFFQDHQNKATYNVGSTKPDCWCHDDPTTKPDHYPNLDAQVGLNLSYGDTNLSTYTHSWAYNTDDAYGIAPNAAVDFYLKPSSNLDGPFSLDELMPCAISVVPTYAYLATEGQQGASASSGLLSIQDRNTYSFVLSHACDCDDTPWQTLQLTEINTLYHDTNQELLPPQPGPIRYQNWVRFGLGLSYANLGPPPAKPDLCDPIPPKAPTNSLPLAKIEYDYDAFNNQYEEHTVMLTINFTF